MKIYLVQEVKAKVEVEVQTAADDGNQTEADAAGFVDSVGFVIDANAGLHVRIVF